MIVGVLAIQGGFAEHIGILKGLEIDTILVRNARDLDKCTGFIIPGGESTSIKIRLFPEIYDWILAGKPFLGTCAGAIILSNIRPDALVIERNAYGGQQQSFIQNVDFNGQIIDGAFIRAPKIKKHTGKAIANLENGDIVGVQIGRQMAITFHPELTNNTIVHKCFVDLIKGNSNE